MSEIIGLILMGFGAWLFVQWWYLVCILRGMRKTGTAAKHFSYSQLYNIGNPFVD